MDKKKGLISFPEMIFLLISYYMLINSNWMLNNTLLRHIVTGEKNIKLKSIMKIDIFSYTMAGKKWINLCWGSDLLSAILYNFKGITGTILFYIVILAITYSLIYWYFNKKYQNGVISLIITGVIVYFSIIQWVAIPFVLSLFYGTIFLIIIDGVKNSIFSYKNLWLLILIQILWVNSTEEFYYGIIIAAAYIIGIIGEDIINKKKSIVKNNKIWIMFLFGLLIALFINPWGYEVYTIYLKELMWKISYRAGEWKSPDFQNTYKIIKNMYMLILLIVLWSCYKKKENIKLYYAILFGIWNFLFFFGQINMGMFIIIAFFVIYEIANNKINMKKENKVSVIYKNINEILNGRNRLNIIVIAVCILFLGVISKNYEPFYKEEIKSWNRSTGVDFVIEKKINGRGLYLDYTGDMLIWKSKGNHKVYMDSRYMFYKEEILNNAGKMLLINKGYGYIILKNNIEWVLVQEINPLCRVLKNDKEMWVNVFYEKGVKIFFRRDYYQKIKDRVTIIE